MFEAAELGRKIDKETYEKLAPALRTELLRLQLELKETPLFPVLVIFAGVDGAGKSETINLLHSWIDPRGLVTRAYDAPSEEEVERPRFWRYWRDLPPKGKMGLYLSAWYSRPILQAVYGELRRGELDHELERISEFEDALAADGALILKFWMHLPKKSQKQRLKAMEKDPLLGWRVTDRDWKHYALYDQFITIAERTIMRTSTHRAPWKIIEGGDERYRELTVLTEIRDAVSRHLTEIRAAKEARALQSVAESIVSDGADAAEGADGESSEKSERIAAAARAALGERTMLRSLDMTRTLDKKGYRRALKRAQAELHMLYREARQRGRSVILMFEGWDAAGKGGAIRRITSALDARDFQVVPIAAPTDEERARHYLWRFWRHLSRAGRVTIFDRSWYGRVLVERVEGFASEAEWRRAYAEINQFEEQLVDFGIILVKYWLHITPEEQLARFEARAQTPFKRWKLTEEDWRNREKWPDYAAAVNEMVERTSTFTAPWVLVEANDKRFARVKVIEAVCERMRLALHGSRDPAEQPVVTGASRAIMRDPPKSLPVDGHDKGRKAASAGAADKKGKGKGKRKRREKTKRKGAKAEAAAQATSS